MVIVIGRGQIERRDIQRWFGQRSVHPAGVSVQDPPRLAIQAKKPVLFHI